MGSSSYMEEINLLPSLKKKHNKLIKLERLLSITSAGMSASSALDDALLVSPLHQSLLLLAVSDGAVRKRKMQAKRETIEIEM